MTRVAKLYLAALAGLAADERRKVRGQGVLTKETTRTLHQLVERQSERHERAEHGLQVRHQERRRHPLAGHIAQNEIQVAAFCPYQIAVISADESDRLVVISHFPSARVEVGRRQQPALNMHGEFEVFCERLLLLSRQIAETETHQRVS